MESIQDELNTVRTELDRALGQIGFEALQAEEAALRAQMEAPDFWQDSQRAQAVSQQQAKLQRRLEPWQRLDLDVKDADELASLGDDTLAGLDALPRLL